MGQGRRDRGALHRAGPARNGAVAIEAASVLKSYTIKKTGKTLLTGLSVGRRPRRARLPDRDGKPTSTSSSTARSS
jgi:hypothetical protein